jgi:hypothetical protein
LRLALKISTTASRADGVGLPTRCQVLAERFEDLVERGVVGCIFPTK